MDKEEKRPARRVFTIRSESWFPGERSRHCLLHEENLLSPSIRHLFKEWAVHKWDVDEDLHPNLLAVFEAGEVPGSWLPWRESTAVPPWACTSCLYWTLQEQSSQYVTVVRLERQTIYKNNQMYKLWTLEIVPQRESKPLTTCSRSE